MCSNINTLTNGRSEVEVLVCIPDFVQGSQWLNLFWEFVLLKMTLIGSVSYISKYNCNRSVILVNNYQMEDPPQNVPSLFVFLISHHISMLQYHFCTKDKNAMIIIICWTNLQDWFVMCFCMNKSVLQYPWYLVGFCMPLTLNVNCNRQL